MARPQPSTFLHAEFAAGVTACLRSWSALRTAVESGWGGGTALSQAKAEDLRSNILDALNGQKPPLYATGTTPGASTFTLAVSNYDVHDLEDNMAIYLEEQFSVNLEDGSDRQVSETIMILYESCWRGDPALSHQLMSQAAGAASLLSVPGYDSGQSENSKKVLVHSNPEDDDSDSDNDDDDDASMRDDDDTNNNNNSSSSSKAMTAQEYASQPVFGRRPNNQSPNDRGPVRQLGEELPEEEVMDLDDDGFAPVKPKGRRKR